MPLPEQFNGPQRAVLRAALLDAFPLPTDFAMFLSDCTGRLFLQIVPESVPYVNQLDSLLLEANAKAWIRDLIVAACEKAPANPKLAKFARAHSFQASEPAVDGSLVPISYDRFYQVQDFGERFKAAIEGPTALQKYLVFGEEYEQHRSLVKRLVKEYVNPAAGGDLEGAVRVVEVLEWWPGDSPVLRKRVGQALHKRSLSRAKSMTGAYEILAGIPGFCETKILVVSQQIALKAWDQGSADLLNWYLGEFWKMTLGPKDPAIVLLVQVECKQEMAAPVGEGPCPKAQVLAALTSLAQAKAPAPPLVLELPAPPILLDELGELEEIDIRNWYVDFLANKAGTKLSPEDEAKRVREKARTRRNGIRRTDDIERSLTDVYEQWNAKVGVE